MRTFAIASIMVLASGLSVRADLYAVGGETYSASSGTLSASANFRAIGGVGSDTLIVTLTNTSIADALVPVDILTGLFFNSTPAITLTRISAVLNTGSVVHFGGTDPGGVVGGEWAYQSGLTGAPGTNLLGVGSAGYGFFGPGDRFPGTNLQGPASPDGLQYGITSAGDNMATGNTPVTGTHALIQNSVVFTFAFTPQGQFEISNLSFQYGTDLSEPNIVVPVPGAALLGALGLGLVGWRRQKKA